MKEPEESEGEAKGNKNEFSTLFPSASLFHKTLTVILNFIPTLK